MSNQNLTILVEGLTDQSIVSNLLFAADLLPKGRIQIEVCGGKAAIAKRVRGLTNRADRTFFALVDADQASLADSQQLAREQLGNPAIKVFCAVPTIEAWLFADIDAARLAARNANAIKLVDRAPLPEMIPYPKQLAFNVFWKGGESRSYDFLRSVDITAACSRSPSLRALISAVSGIFEQPVRHAPGNLGTTISRDVFSTFLREVPAQSVAWRTLDGTEITAERMARAVAEGETIGKQYVTEVIRVARDLVARKARK